MTDMDKMMIEKVADAMARCWLELEAGGEDGFVWPTLAEAAITAYNPDDRLTITDEMIAAGAKQMRAVLNDGGWDDETVFQSALEAAGIDSALFPLPHGEPND